jgi:hypothetical protein
LVGNQTLSDIPKEFDFSLEVSRISSSHARRNLDKHFWASACPNNKTMILSCQVAKRFDLRAAYGRYCKESWCVCLVPRAVDGINQLPVLEGQVEKLRKDVLIEEIDDPRNLRSKCIVTDELKLTWYFGQSYGKLYDLVEDANERVNRWDDPAYADGKARLAYA